MNQIAINPQTGELAEFDGSAWNPVDKSRVAQDASGNIAVFDGAQWKQIGVRPGPTKAAAATQEQGQAQYLRSQNVPDAFQAPQRIDPNATGDTLRENPSDPATRVTGALGKYVDAAMLGGADETLAGIYGLGAMMPGGRTPAGAFQKELARLEQNHRDYEALNTPEGSVATGAGIVFNPLNLMGGEFVAAGKNAFTRAGRSAGLGGTIGGTAGALSTEGGVPERAMGAGFGAGFGALAGGVAQPGLELFGLGARKGLEAGSGVLNTVRNQMQARGDPAAQADKLLMRAFLDDQVKLGYSPAPVNAPLPGQGLVNMGGDNVSSLARQANLAPGPTRARAAEFFGEQAAGAPDRAADAVRNMSNAGYYGTVETLDKTRQLKAEPLYKQAYAANQSVASPLIDRILATPAGKSALGKAATMMQNDMSLMGVPDSELTALVNELVSLGKMEAPNTGRGVAAGLKLRSLDYVKRALDSQYEELTRAGKNTEAGIILDLKKKLVAEIDKADTTGLYKQARAAWAGPSHALEVVEKGREFYKFRGKPADVLIEFQQMTPEDKALARIGFVRDAIEDLGNVGDNGSVYLKLYGNQNKRTIMEAMFPDYQSFKTFADQMLAEKAMLAVNRKVTGGSPTAPILAENAAYDQASNALGIVDALRSGNMFRVAGMALDKARNLQRGVTPEVADQLGQRLFATDPASIQRILSQIQSATPAPISAISRGLLRNTPIGGLLGQGSGLLGSAMVPSPVIVPPGPLGGR